MNPKHLETLLICSVRYALGRMTYIVEDVASLVEVYVDDLDKRVHEIIMRDILEELRLAESLGKTLGSQYDQDVWVKLYKTLEEKLERKIDEVP